MALAGEKVGIPSAEEAPLVVMARFKQPLAGLYSIIIVFAISFVTWLLFFDPRWHIPLPNQKMEFTAWATVIGGFGLIGVAIPGIPGFEISILTGASIIAIVYIIRRKKFKN